MKSTILLAVISMAVLVGCSHMQDTKRIPASTYNQQGPCGLEGSVEDRIADCSHQRNARQEGFVLVTRSSDFKEVHKDTRTGLLWSDRLNETMTHRNAEQACQENLQEMTGIEATWRLPSIQEYLDATRNGAIKVLPNRNYAFWCSPIANHDLNAHVYILANAQILAGSRSSHNMSVRCVAKLAP